MNWKLILNILTTVNGGLITGAALFNPLVGQDISLKMISALGICQIIVSGINSNLSTQANQIAAVAAIPGVEGVKINSNATPAIAAVATDPAQPRVGATTPEVRSVLQNLAKGA